VLRVAAGGKSVGRAVFDNIYFRERQTGRDTQILHQPIELAVGRKIDFLGAGHGQDDFIREPIRKKRGNDADRDRDDQEARIIQGIAENITDGDDKQKKSGQKEPAFPGIGVGMGIKSGHIYFFKAKRRTSRQAIMAAVVSKLRFCSFSFSARSLSSSRVALYSIKAINCFLIFWSKIRFFPSS